MNKYNFRKIDNKRKGITLIELLIVLSLIGIIITLGYSVLEFSRKVHEDTVRKMDRQESLKQASRFIKNELSTAFYLEIADSEYTVDEDKYGDKFIQSNGNDIKFKFFNKSEDKWKENIILNYKNTFEIEKSENDSVAIFTISIIDNSDKVLESITSRVYVSNMLAERQKIESPIGGGSYFLYNNTTKVSPLPTPGISTGCFIATATYGSESHPYIVLLKEFRDDHLAKYSLGKVFINNYYKYSPKYSDFIEKSRILKFITRILLAPIVTLVFIIIKIPDRILNSTLIIFLMYIYKKNKLSHKGGDHH